MEKKPQLKHELLDFVRDNQKLASAHAAFMAAGGERLLELAVNSMRGEMFPWDAAPHVQASFGAFVGGGTWMAKLLRNAVALANNRAAALRTLAQADGGLTADDRRVLVEQYGYTDAEIDEFEKQPAAGKPKAKTAQPTQPTQPKEKK